MKVFNFKKWNTIMGWITFGIALLTYSTTVEPTISFWDCSEYIATSARLEIGHPPGAPLFQMIGAFFAMFATTPDKVALMVNMMSVFSSAFTVLFMFWSLTLLLKRIFINDKKITFLNYIMVLGSAFVAATSFTFTDSFWYNAVEAEVYAMSSLFTALLFWLGLRWEQDLHHPKGNKWLVLISLVIGLSFGVHFLGLLTLPAIGMLYYFKKYNKVTVKGFVIANVVTVGILYFIFKFLLPYTLAFFGKTEIFMVNSLGLPFNSGTIFSFIFIILIFYFGLRYTAKKELVFYNTILLSVLFLLIGFSTWLMLPIRANANPPINENKPSDAAEVLAYYNREQYGEQKILWGAQFSEKYSGLDAVQPYLDAKPNYERDYTTGKYVIINDYKNARPNLDNNHKTFLPRMRNTENAVNYMHFTTPLDFRIHPDYADEEELIKIVAHFKQGFKQGEFTIEDYDQFLQGYGDYLIVDKPSFINNLKFMFNFQFGNMYWRYLMWNFTGRQNDKQWKGDTANGNWISGIPFIDEIRLGSQKNLTSDMKNNKGRNVYYFLPFILAIIGMVFHAKTDIKGFYVLLVLFLFTGFILKIYLNERPFEPRERDYALVGSFYAFAMWIAFGVYSLYVGMKKYLQPKLAGATILIVTLLASPILLAKENWDDHNRSGKYTALTMAKAYLDSCEPNAILFTIGDNDTFPLWYLQEVEHYRTDVRIVNTQLIAADWYIDQMKRKAWQSEPVPISFTHDMYKGNNRDYSMFVERTKDSISLNDLMTFIRIDDERAKIEMNSGKKINYFPSKKIFIPIDKATIIKNKVVPAKYYNEIVPVMEFTIEDFIYKNRLIMLDIVNENNWKRPIYFTGGAYAEEDYIWMKNYLQLSGMCFKLVPIKTEQKDTPNPIKMGFVDTDSMYDIVTKWEWKNSGSNNIYHDPETRKNSISYRINLARLMEELIDEGKEKKAEEIIEITLTNLPIEQYGHYSMVEPFAKGYYELDKIEKARKIYVFLLKKYQEELTYYSTMSPNEKYDNQFEIMLAIERYRLLVSSLKEQDALFYDKEKVKFNNFNKLFKEFEREDLE